MQSSGVIAVERPGGDEEIQPIQPEPIPQESTLQEPTLQEFIPKEPTLQESTHQEPTQQEPTQQENRQSILTEDTDLYDTSPGDINEDGKEKVPPPERPTYEQLAQKNPGPTEHLSITLGPPMIILFDIVVPCIIYYVWYDINRDNWEKECSPQLGRGEVCPIPKPQFNKEILGYAVISFGFGELYILIARVWRLIKHRDLCAPLLSRSPWELDATSWVYAVAMVCALIPFVIGSAKEIPQLYLYSPAFLMGFLLVLMIITLIPFPIPYGINSHARGTPMRPFIYYAAEDFIAVDGLQDREFRVRYNARYDSSKPFRRLFVYLTLWWIFGVFVYIGCLSAVIWNLEFHYAFGTSLGVLFSWIILWAIVSYLWVGIEMDRQRKAYEKGAPV
ncbi:hypothetical protein LSUE1_G010251 [Lachnellula suecica]|uniref:Uncharacterized protein n=1 Tax=Lachnellula suecica TaxID=602035 RepID=A0A8T9BX83_9HELO|nr:hypothetical protein LSUE1_G010251 [Lachnellula suecica]